MFRHTMFRHAVVAGAAVIVGCLCQSSLAVPSFTSDLSMSGPATVNPDDPMSVVVNNVQTYGVGVNDSAISGIYLRWVDSTGLDLSTAGWAFDSVLATLNFDVDTDLSDGFVHAQGAPAVTVAPASPFALGQLDFNAPLTPGFYTLTLSGGTDIGETSSAVLAPAAAATVEQGTMNLTDFQFEVLPEPGMLALVALGGMALLRRRRK